MTAHGHCSCLHACRCHRSACRARCVRSVRYHLISISQHCGASSLRMRGKKWAHTYPRHRFPVPSEQKWANVSAPTPPEAPSGECPTQMREMHRILHADHMEPQRPAARVPLSSLLTFGPTVREAQCASSSERSMCTVAGYHSSTRASVIDNRSARAVRVCYSNHTERKAGVAYGLSARKHAAAPTVWGNTAAAHKQCEAFCVAHREARPSRAAHDRGSHWKE